MKFQKTNRILNPTLIEKIKKLKCLVCDKSPCDAHHVTTRAAGGADSVDNLMPLCRAHHTQAHKAGMGYMAQMYPSISDWLLFSNRDDILEKIRR